MKSRWVEHKGYQIFISDFSDFGMDHDGLQAEANAVKAELGKYEPNSVRSVTYVSGTVATSRAVKVLQSLLPVTNYYIMKRAVVGVSGVRKQLVALFNRLTGRAKFVIFDTVEEALDYLVEN